ncbi:MAG: D-alanine--D-alanine ligase [Rickettsiaceae bacterium]|nr:MAG: D-alanine--D-alanine ligase [Rickettsiaceae bacterium]
MKQQTTPQRKSVVTHHSTEGRQYIAVVGAGMSLEREVSISSSAGVIKALVANGYKVTFIDMGSDIASVLQTMMPDIVYNCLHGTYGEDGCLPGLLNILGIPYTHSGVLSSALAFSKKKSERIFAASNILTAKSIIVNKEDQIQGDPLPRPYVIKPDNQGSSIGVEIILEQDQFNFANYDFPYGNSVMIEEYIKGREMQVAVLNGKSLGALEIKLLQNKRFYDYETKYNEGFAEHILITTADSIYNELLTQAEKAYNLLGCRGLVRAEFIYDQVLGKLFILELNTHPGMTPLSICPEIALSTGLDYNQLVEIIVQSASLD